MYATFGQELYTRETTLAAEIVAAACHRQEKRRTDGTQSAERLLSAADTPHRTAAEHQWATRLTSQIAESLPHPSHATRLRLAEKLLQRLTAGSAHPDGRAAFPRLLAQIPDTDARRELVYYAVVQTDGLVGAIARELLYPYFIEERLPRGVPEADFNMRNTGWLLMLEPLLTLPFLAWYAEKHWDFLSTRTVGLALRIQRQAGIVLSTVEMREDKRILAYSLAPHGLSLPAFLWCLYDEFSAPWSQSTDGNGFVPPVAPTVDRVERSCFARAFVVPPAVIGARLREAERRGFVRCENGIGGRRVIMPLSRPALVDSLIGSVPPSPLLPQENAD